MVARLRWAGAHNYTIRQYNTDCSIGSTENNRREGPRSTHNKYYESLDRDSAMKRLLGMVVHRQFKDLDKKSF